MIYKILCALFALSCFFTQAQEKVTSKKHEFDLNYFYGNILEHNKDIGHLITGHPQGFIFSYNQKTFGEKSGSDILIFLMLGLR